MRIAQALIDQLVEHALEEAPLECCGLIAIDEGVALGVWRMTNAAQSATRYEIDGAEHFRAVHEMKDLGLCPGAFYHSHTLAPPVPSETDIALCSYPEAVHVIVGVESPDWPEVRAWWIFDHRAVEEPLEVT